MENVRQFNDRLVQELEQRNEFDACGCAVGILEVIGGAVVSVLTAGNDTSIEDDGLQRAGQDC